MGIVTNTLPGVHHALVTADGVYVPQQDSQLLVDTLERTTVVAGRHVMDLCTGTGIAAIAAAGLGASSVTAWDICLRAVRCAQTNAAHRGVVVDVRQGSLLQALRHGPYDVVVSNPPYVPTPHGDDYVALPADVGPARAWDAGEDGRLLLDPLCASAPDLLTAGGVLLLDRGKRTRRLLTARRHWPVTGGEGSRIAQHSAAGASRIEGDTMR